MADWQEMPWRDFGLQWTRSDKEEALQKRFYSRNHALGRAVRQKQWNKDRKEGGFGKTFQHVRCSGCRGGGAPTCEHNGVWTWTTRDMTRCARILTRLCVIPDCVCFQSLGCARLQDCIMLGMSVIQMRKHGVYFNCESVFLMQIKYLAKWLHLQYDMCGHALLFVCAFARPVLQRVYEPYTSIFSFSSFVFKFKCL